ncbi:hypothetical protein M3Y98_00541700 [Aphelenchoides besseyi]|nr:hypothetical protein M3Y98_00541700 [Aphelenchoides besseyi]KAI6208142.1 hypothetical protein M3Y96_00083600 [Aphelenchoides besseyi]
MYGYAQNPNAAQNYTYENIFGVNADPYNATQQYQQCLSAFNHPFASPQVAAPQLNASIAPAYGNGLIDAFTGVQYATSSHPIAAVETNPTFGSFEQALLQQQVRLQQPQQRHINQFQPHRMIAPKRNFNNFPVVKPNAAFNVPFQKRKPQPKQPTDPAKYYCDVCKITCGSMQAFQDHIGGKSHRRKDELSKGNAQPLAKYKASYKCEVCNVTCTGKEAFTTHINGIKHSRAIKNLQRVGKPVPEKISSVLNPQQTQWQKMSKADEANLTANNMEMPFDGTPNEEDEDSSDMGVPIGEEYVEVIEGVSVKQTQYRCKLCDCVCGDPVAKNLHLRGKRHRIQYKQKVDSSVYVDPKASNQTMRSKKYKEMKKISHFPSNFAMYPLDCTLPVAIPDTAANDSYDEQHIYARLEQLRQEPSIMEVTNNLIALVESTLKYISDRLGEQSEKPNEVEQHRLLKGVIRTGPLGDRLLLKSDEEITAVLVCSKYPTVSLLQQIVSMFVESIKDETLKAKTTVKISLEDGGFSIKFNDSSMYCTVKLITLLWLESEETKVDDAKKIEKPADALPVSLQALADFRYTQFFKSECWNVPGLSETVALIRDVSQRYNALNFMSLHIIELIAFKSVISSPHPLRVSDAFRRFFEVLASGQFMSRRSRLFDPCEKNETDVLAALTAQQREDIVCCAQEIVRLIAFDRIHTVLGMERLSMNRKRPNKENEDDNDAKKEKKDVENAEDATGKELTIE